MSLKHSYTLIAPFYDAAISQATRAARKRSLAVLPKTPSKVLLAGVGTGLDLPHLPAHHHYVGIDLTHAMLRRALPRASHVNFTAVRGDAQSLPFATGCFDVAVLHLILAVVPTLPAALPKSGACCVRAARRWCSTSFCGTVSAHRCGGWPTRS